jgi:hypothetical protein
VEFHPFAQMEDPGLLVVGGLLPLLGEVRHQLDRPGGGEVEADQALEDREAQEAHALEAVVGHARGGRDVRRRHGDAQYLLLGKRRASAQGAGGEQGKQTAFHARASGSRR